MIFYLLLEIFNPLNFPKNINGWIKVDYKNYNKENIFDYINGEGEVYISFDFIKLDVFYYKKGKNEIIINIFKMKKPRHSFGIFTHLRGNGEEIIELGEEAEIFRNCLIFWEGNYFVSISSRESILKSELVYISKEVEKYLKKGKEDLEILRVARELKLNMKKIKYFYNMNILNYYYYFMNEDLFNFKGGTQGIFSPYKDGYILILLFKNEREARVGVDNLKEKFYGGGYIIKEIDEGKWSGYISKNRLLKVFLDFPSKESIKKELNEDR